MRVPRPSLERVGQVAFIVMCLVVSAVGIQRLVASPAPAGDRPPVFEPGVALDLAEPLRPGGARGVLILALSTNCQYCTASMPFYQSLRTLGVVRDGRIRLAVVSLQPEEQMKEYLASHDAVIEPIVIARNSGVRLQATPTALLVGADGRVVNSWAGQLPPADEQALVRELTRLASQ